MPSPSIPARISAAVRAYRRDHNLNQTDFGDLLGVSAQAVSKWERELCCPDITLLPDLARLLGVSVGDLLGVEEVA